MGGKKPGPMCATSAESIDAGTNCRQRSRPPGASGTASDTQQRPAPIKFSQLWDGYPGSKPYVDAKGDIPKGFENQCAIKVSVALGSVGVTLASFRGAFVSIKGQKAAIRAEQMAAWLGKEKIAGVAAQPRHIEGLADKDRWPDRHRLFRRLLAASRRESAVGRSHRSLERQQADGIRH
jgi:hypothetical protein